MSPKLPVGTQKFTARGFSFNLACTSEAAVLGSLASDIILGYLEIEYGQARQSYPLSKFSNFTIGSSEDSQILLPKNKNDLSHNFIVECSDSAVQICAQQGRFASGFERISGELPRYFDNYTWNAESDVSLFIDGLGFSLKFRQNKPIGYQINL